jgi:murein DD-endopeptidase MepM/ murein hydrolase activator NlpD
MLLAESLDAATGASYMDIDFGRPFPTGYDVYATSGWEDGRDHPGLDIRAPVGTPVQAIAAGKVVSVAYDSTHSGGKWIAIDHDRGWRSRYFHLSQQLVRVGQQVQKGQIIGKSGETGSIGKPHLHLDLKVLPSMIPFIEMDVGRVRTGYFSERDGRTGVPGEPWIPVDRYSEKVQLAARKWDIPLYAERVAKRINAPTPGTEVPAMAPRSTSRGAVMAVIGGGVFVAGLSLWLGLSR